MSKDKQRFLMSIGGLIFPALVGMYGVVKGGLRRFIQTVAIKRVMNGKRRSLRVLNFMGNTVGSTSTVAIDGSTSMRCR